MPIQFFTHSLSYSQVTSQDQTMTENVNAKPMTDQEITGALSGGGVQLSTGNMIALGAAALLAVVLVLK